MSNIVRCKLCNFPVLLVGKTGKGYCPECKEWTYEGELLPLKENTNI